MSRPSWLEPLPAADEMRATDAWAIEERGVPSLELMERAGQGLADVTATHAPAGRVVVVCGKGNNGGDGLVAARILRQAGREVEVLADASPDELRGDAAEQLRRLPGDPPRRFDAASLAGASGIVDALLGTGATGPPREPEVIEAINAAGSPVIAADVPSGVNASTGEVEGTAIRAVATATFHRAKPGLWIHPGKAHAGTVEVIEIGIPPGAPVDPGIGLIAPGVLAEMPRRTAESTKFSSGNVFVIGGSSGLTGAPTMAAMAAMRAGAGYVTVGAPATLEGTFATRLLEAMLRGLPEQDGSLTVDAVEPAVEAIRRADAVVLGPGLGRSEGAQAFARALFERADVPLVVDADGLNALVDVFRDELPQRPGPTVLTPHAGELGRLLGLESDQIAAHRLAHARAAAAHARAIVVLKGDDTLVAAPEGRVAVSPGRAPALATAGTGDVLSGVLGAMLAKGLAPAHAACAAVHVHLRAGQHASEPHGPDAVIASDVIAHLPQALAD
jgi:hydroxyethylthiazole kinase-like uncharacterized protein yjeF